MSKLILPFNFERQYNAPLEVDYKVETLTDLETLKSKPTTYEGMLTYCVEDSTLYIFNKDGNFEPVSGSSGSTVDVIEKDNTNAISSNGVYSGLYEEALIKIIDTPENYVLCQSTDDGALLTVDTVTESTTEVLLSDVQVFVPDATLGEYYQHIEEVSHEEWGYKEKYTRLNDTYASNITTYSSKKISNLITQATGGGAVIDDNAISEATVFSSSKINTDYATKDEIPNLSDIIDDDQIVTYKTYSSSKIEDVISQKTDIDDTITSTDKTWSSDRIIKIINSVSSVYKVDEKPICVDNRDGTYTTTYVQNGETKTTNDVAWYYYLVDGTLYQTIFIEGDELSIKNSSMAELITIDETTNHWMIDGDDTGVSAKPDALEPNINNSSTDYRLDVIGNDGTKKFTTDNLKGADGVLLDNVGYYGFTVENGSLILHVNVEDTSTGDADDIAPPFSLDTGYNLWYTIGGKIKYVSKEVI